MNDWKLKAEIGATETESRLYMENTETGEQVDLRAREISVDAGVDRFTTAKVSLFIDHVAVDLTLSDHAAEWLRGRSDRYED